jgi:hypothetical protein
MLRRSGLLVVLLLVNYARRSRMLEMLLRRSGALLGVVRMMLLDERKPVSACAYA